MGWQLAKAQLDKSFLNEARAAARGVLALLTGDHAAPGYFLFSQVGLVSSFIAVLAVTTIEVLLSASLMSGGLFVSLVQNAIPYAALLGSAWLYLRQIGRMDAFLPFVVALNWANAVLSVALIVAALLGLGFLIFVIAAAILVALVNIARLIMTLKPMQIVVLMIVQIVGVFVAVIVLTLLFPPTPEQLAQVTAAAGNRPS